MDRGRTGWQRAIVLTAAGLLLAAGLAAPVAAGGNADAAHACAQGGYADLQGSDGSRFDNPGECVSYVARGGSISGVVTGCAYTAGTTGCVRFDDVFVPVWGGTTVGTTLAGMFTFAPVTSWIAGTTTPSVTGSGTWVTSTGRTGTWTATSVFPYYETKFEDSSGFTTCGAASTRYVAAHLTIAEDGTSVTGVIEIQVRIATTGTNYVLYQGFSETAIGEPLGLHGGTDMTGVTISC